MKSQVWKHFEISVEDSRLVICKMCNTRISRGSSKCSTSFNTSNMGKHILSKHREVYPLHRKVSPAQASLLQKQKVYDINDPCAKAISKHIGTMIVKYLQPFSIVEDAGFQGLMKHIVPQYNIESTIAPLFCG